ncbi:MAG: hypothetical protein V1698_01880 [bacterium]
MQIKINKQNQQTNPEVVQQARKDLEEKRNSNLEDLRYKQTSHKMRDLFFYSRIWGLFILLILAANICLFSYFKPKKQPYLNYIPETNLKFTIPKEKIKEIINSPENFSFLSSSLQKINQISSQLKIDSNLQTLLENIDQDLIISSNKTGDKTNLLIISQFSSAYDKAPLESDIKQNFDTSSEVYRGENIIKVVSLNSKNESFAYSFIDDGKILLVGNDASSIKQGIDKGK